MSPCLIARGGGTQDPLSVIAAGGKPGVGVGQETDRGGHRGTTPPPGQFLLLGVPDGHFQHQLWGELEKLGVIAVGLEQERQDIEAASRGFPALLNTDLGTESPVTSLPLPLPTQQAHGLKQALRGLSVMRGVEESKTKPKSKPPLQAQSDLITEPGQLLLGTQVSVFQKGSPVPAVHTEGVRAESD